VSCKLLYPSLLYFTFLIEILNQNRFNWTTPLRDLLGPSFELYNEELTTQTTLEDILSHRTGIPDYGLLMFSGYSYNVTREQLVRYAFSFVFLSVSTLWRICIGRSGLFFVK